MALTSPGEINHTKTKEKEKKHEEGEQEQAEEEEEEEEKKKKSGGEDENTLVLANILAAGPGEKKARNAHDSASSPAKAKRQIFLGLPLLSIWLGASRAGAAGLVSCEACVSECLTLKYWYGMCNLCSYEIKKE